eukprot:11211948-Lingulodinium_polyedra.AAC.1
MAAASPPTAGGNRKTQKLQNRATMLARWGTPAARRVGRRPRGPALRTDAEPQKTASENRTATSHGGGANNEQWNVHGRTPVPCANTRHVLAEERARTMCPNKWHAPDTANGAFFIFRDGMGDRSESDQSHIRVRSESDQNHIRVRS